MKINKACKKCDWQYIERGSQPMYFNEHARLQKVLQNSISE